MPDVVVDVEVKGFADAEDAKAFAAEAAHADPLDSKEYGEHSPEFVEGKEPMAHSWHEATGVLKALHRFKVGLGHVELDHVEEAKIAEAQNLAESDDEELLEVAFTLRFGMDKPELDAVKFSEDEELKSQFLNSVGIFLGVDSLVVEIDNIRAGSVIVDTLVAVADESQAQATMKKLDGPAASKNLLDEAVFGAVEVSNVVKRVNGEPERAEKEEDDEEGEARDIVPNPGAVSDGGGGMFLDMTKRRKVAPAFPKNGKPVFNVSAPETKVTSAMSLRLRVAARASSLTKVVLNNTPLSEEGVVMVARALESGSQLEELSCTSCHVGVAGVRAISKVMSCSTTLKTIDLSFNNVGSAGLRVLAKGILDQSQANGAAGMLKLDLSHNPLVGKPYNADPSGLEELLAALATHPASKVVSFASTGLGHPNVVLPCMMKIAKWVKEDEGGVEKLDLSGNRIDVVEVSKLAMWVGSNDKLKILDLRGNDVERTRASNLFSRVGEQLTVIADSSRTGKDDADAGSSGGSAPDDSADGSLIEFVGDLEATETIKAAAVVRGVEAP